MFIPGLLISILTFPGVIVHEWAHKHACDRADIPVHEVVYFRLGNPVGFVNHQAPRRFSESFTISGAPFAINSSLALGLMIPFPLLQEMARAGNSAAGYLSLLVVWLAFSIGVHALPSRGDAKNVWNHMKADQSANKMVLLASPIVAIIYVLDLLRVVWADAIYSAIMVGAGWLFGIMLLG